MRGFQLSVTRRNATQSTAAAVPQLPQRSAVLQPLLNAIAALIDRVRFRPSSVAEKSRSRFYLFAERRKGPQAPLRRLRLRKKGTQHFFDA